jgi:hypothetical protein
MLADLGASRTGAQVHTGATSEVAAATPDLAAPPPALRFHREMQAQTAGTRFAIGAAER